MTSTPLLEVEQLLVRYVRITAVNHVNLRVKQGETVAIVGPNGAGKSSLLSAIAGVVSANSGSIRFLGRSVLGQSLEATMRRGISLVPEGRHVFSGLTVLENLRIGAVTRSDRARVNAEIKQFTEMFPILGRRRNQLAGQLSGGEQQMLVIARALLAKPTLLMLDEPSLGLAPAVTDQIYQLLTELGEQGLSVLVVEQNAQRALGAAHRTYVLNGGRVRLDGPSQQLNNHPDFEAAYFGVEGQKP